MRHPRSRGMNRWSLAGASILSSLLLGLVLAAGGCTSDDANTVGAPLVEATYDTVLAPLQIEQIDLHGPDSAQVTLYVAMAGRPVADVDALAFDTTDQGAAHVALIIFENKLTRVDTFISKFLELATVAHTRKGLLRLGVNLRHD